MAETTSKLSRQLLEKAREELNEDQFKVPDQIQSLREKILEDTNLSFKTDDAFLLKFLRSRKFDQERTLELMKNYYKQRIKYPEVFSKTVAADIEKVTNSHCLYALQDRDEEGRVVCLFNFERWDANEVSMDEIVYSALMLMEFVSEDESVQINGCVLVADLAGFTLAHASLMTPWKIKEMAAVLLNSFPLRYKAIHYVNESPLFDTVFVILKPFLSKKLQERNVFHGNCYASLHEYINPEILPEDLGGDIDPFDYDIWADRIKKQSQTMEDNISKYGFLITDKLENEAEK